MSRLAAFLNMPQEIFGAVLGILSSIGTLSLMAVNLMFAQVPTPDVTHNWSFYGVLISAIVALAVSLGWVLRWVAVTWLTEQRENRDVMEKLVNASQKQTESNVKVLAWLEEFAKEMIRDGVKASVHDRLFPEQ